MAKRATLDGLLKKPVRTKQVVIKTQTDAGKESELSLLFKAISSQAYDDLLSEHTPTKAQAKEGNQWNPDTFPPALISVCSADPVIDLASAELLWTSDAWSRGELMDLFISVVKLNSDGLDVPFT